MPHGHPYIDTYFGVCFAGQTSSANKKKTEKKLKAKGSLTVV